MNSSYKQLLSVLLALTLCGKLYAQISPGKLSQAHSELEGIKNCVSCHELGKDVEPSKCLSCHATLSRQISNNKGFHSSDQVTSSQCVKCHNEHHGREFELVRWAEGRDKFDHKLTGYELKGKHFSLECSKCHQPDNQSDFAHDDKTINAKRTFLGLSQECLQCHDDQHRQQLGNECLKCHGYDGWKPATGFDHNSAAFELQGKHTNLECQKCHQQANQETGDAYTLYKPLEYQKCSACHTDPHKGTFIASCVKCHSVDGFRNVKLGGFDHNVTDYPLQGKHVKVDCNKCHTSGKATDSVTHDKCTDCHKDFHQGQFAMRADGNECSTCHTVNGFIPAQYGFEQHQRSEYQLTGSHLAVPCLLCHRPDYLLPDSNTPTTRFDFGDNLRCQTCHEDVHQRQLDIWIEKKGCEFCHSTATWHKTSFDHKLARFELSGKHREINCLQCHQVKNETGDDLVWMKPLEMECYGCHIDQHEQQFLNKENITDCQRCHQTEGWDKLMFVHNRDAEFKLDGAHKDVACNKCHITLRNADGLEYTKYKGIGTACVNCHKS